MDLNDNRLAAIARGDEVANAAELEDMAAELLRLRRHARGDSRRSVQVRRLRWAVENLIVKTERLLERTTAPHEAVVEKMIAAACELEKEVRALPIELDEVRVDVAIVKWLTLCRDETKDATTRETLVDVIDKIMRGDWKEVLRG